MAACQRAVSSREFAEWMAFATLAPFGARRGDWQAALVASTVANTARDPKRRREPFQPADFLLAWEREPQRQDWEAQLALVEVLNRAFGGRDLRGGNGVTQRRRGAEMQR